MKNKQKIHWIVFAFSFIGSIIFFFSAFYYSKTSISNAYKDQIITSHNVLLDKITSFKEEKKEFLLMLNEHPDMLNYVKDKKNIQYRIKVENLFFQLSKSSSSIMQLRLLDPDGKELVRIDQNRAGIKIVEQDRLQDKSKRDYFLEFKKLHNREIGFSKLDLNIENNMVETPFKPTLRISMPIYLDEKLKAIIIVNYDMKNWLNRLSDSPFLNTYLINSNGFFILHPNESLRWSEFIEKPIKYGSVLNEILDDLHDEALIFHNDHLGAQIVLFDNRHYYVIYKPKQDVKNSIIEQSTIIGILILLGLVLVIFPFSKLLYEYVTNLKQTTLTLSESEQRLKAIFDNTFDAIIIINEHGIIKRMNRSTSTIFGYSEDELIDKNIKILIPEPHHSLHDDYLKAHDKSMVSKIIGQERELYGINKNEQLIPISLGVTKMVLNGEIFFIGTLRDISHEKRNKQILEKVFLEAPLGVAIVLENGKFWRINDKFCNIVGYSFNEMRKITFGEITHPDDLDIDLIHVKKIVDGEIDTYHLEKRYIHKNGSVVWVNLTVSAIFIDKEKKVIEYFVAMIEDITEKKEMEKKEKEQELMLMHQSKLASMGEMVGAIAHQWRQPLNSIGLTVQDLISAQKHNELDENYLNESKDEIMQQLKYMSQTIDEFRNFFVKRKEVLLFNLNSTVKDVKKLYWAQLKVHNITLSIHCKNVDDITYNCETTNEDELKCFNILGAESELKQVILNCISNAKDAILQLTNPDLNEKNIDISIQEKESEILVVINDLAGGMDKDVRERIFEPYYTTKEMGTGLGLYIAKMVIEKSLHGTISCQENKKEIDDKKYAGTSFIIKLKKS